MNLERAVTHNVDSGRAVSLIAAPVVDVLSRRACGRRIPGLDGALVLMDGAAVGLGPRKNPGLIARDVLNCALVLGRRRRQRPGRIGEIVRLLLVPAALGRCFLFHASIVTAKLSKAPGSDTESIDNSNLFEDSRRRTARCADEKKRSRAARRGEKKQSQAVGRAAH